MKPFLDALRGRMSSSESSNPSKRCRAAGLSNQVVYCQVYGCNKDLTSSKEYHKRHKVCEVHSKTPKVIVGGIEQRFCQQCSRFHLLCEFDEGKRSCRRRLAGHNERRRKPQVGFHSSMRAARFLFPCNVNGRFHGTNDWISHIKLATTNYDSLSPFKYQDLHPSLPFSSSTAQNSPCSFQENPLFSIDPSLGSEEFGSIFDTGSPIQGISGISDPGCARSLLSSQSQNSFSRTSGIPMDHQSLSQHGIISQDNNLVLVNGGDPAKFEISNEIGHGPGFSNSKGRCFSDGEAPTIDLLQLSSQLRRVEHERQYVKLDDIDSVECLGNT